MAVISISRDTNNNVSLVRMEVSDNLATVGSADYILNHQNEINTLNGGVWDWFMTDMLLVAASDGNGFFFFTDTTFDTLKPYGEQGSGMVNPAVANSVAYYQTTGSSISGITPANNGVLITSNMGVPSISSVLPSAVQANITTVGTINTGVWQGTPVTVPFGGTGDSSFTAYAVICGGTTSTGALQSIAGVGSLGDVLVSNGPGALPTFQTGVASGIINTGNVNDLAYYSVNPTGKTLSGLATANNGVLITSGLGVPSISSTLPSAVQGNITAVGTIASGTWQGNVITGTYGGTGINNGASTITIGGNVAFSGAFTFTGTLTGNTGVTFPTSGTLATTSQIPSFPLSLANGGTNANLTAAAGGVVYSTASALAISAVGSSGQLFQSTGTTAPGWTTATYPSTAGTANNIITSGGTNFTSATLTSVIDAAIGSTQGDILYRNSTVWTVLAPGSAGQLLKTGGAAANPAWTTATFPATGGAAGNVLISDGTNYIASTSLWPNTVGSANNVLVSNGTSNGYSTLTALIDAALGSTQGDILYRNATVWTVLAPGTAELPLVTKGAAANPVWQGLAVAGGGTGVGSINAYSVVLGGTTNTGAIQTVLTNGTSGQVLTSTGSSSSPTWQSPFGSQNVVTGSRALGTTYRNTTGKTMFVSVSVDNSGGGVGTTQAITDSSATPTTVVAQTSNPPITVMPSVTITFMVLNNNYYKISTNVATLDYWTEWY